MASSAPTAPARQPLFACCAGCSPRTRAAGTCLGYDIRTETDKIKPRVGYMTQRFSLYEDLSVRENLEFIAPHLRPRAAAGRRARRDRQAGP